MDPAIYEQLTGLRSTYSAFPASEEQLESYNIPLSINYTPIKQFDDLKIQKHKPVTCQCGGIINPYAKINYNTQTWFCPLCSNNNKIPLYFANLLNSEELPNELLNDNLAMEYVISEKKEKSSFVFLIDTCMSKVNFEGMKNSLVKACDSIDFEVNQICLVTFNRNIFFYKNTKNSEFIHTVMMPTFIKLHDKLKLLGVKNEKTKVLNQEEMTRNYFVDSKDKLINIIDSLEMDYWTTPDNSRAQRSTGKAIEFTLDLLSYCQVLSTRILLFTSGPCTQSEGKIVELKFSNFIRKHLDLEEDKEVKQMSEVATKYYSSLAKRAIVLNSTFDIFAYSLDQFGLFEMRDLVLKTGGLVVLNEEFKQDHFEKNIVKYFVRNQDDCLNVHSRAVITINHSNHVKLCGGIGNFSSLNTKPKNHGENKIGETNTNSWYAGGIDYLASYLFFFEITAKNNNNKAYRSGQNAYIQFQTKYLNSSGEARIRVVTMERSFLKLTKPLEMLDYLDQFSIISTYSKLSAFRSLKQDSFFVRRYLDKKLINILKTFKLNNEIPPHLNLLPQYFYYLRKSSFVIKFASSLDEMVYYRHAILRQNTDNTLVMIQPQIIEYSLNNEEPVPVLPDIDCLKNDVILLADTYFNIIIWKGQTIKAWVDEGYHLKEGYEHIGELVKMPEEDMKFIIEERLIIPNKIEAYFGSPTERFLKSKLNPENKEVNSLHEAVESGNFVTDDACLSDFMKRLLTVINSKES